MVQRVTQRQQPCASMAESRRMAAPTVSGVQKSMARRWYATSGRSCLMRASDQMSRLLTSTKAPLCERPASDAATMPAPTSGQFI